MTPDPDFDVHGLMDGATLLASTANVPISQFPFNACLADLRLRRMLSARQ